MEALTEIEKTFGYAERTVRVPMGMQFPEALENAGVNSYLDQASEEKMPAFTSGGRDLKITFIKATDISNDEVALRLCGRNLVFVHPLILILFNKGYAFNTAEMPQGTAWQDDDGAWHVARFNHWASQYPTEIKPSNDRWEGSWWFAGIEKE